jgi:hypothetical protein
VRLAKSIKRLARFAETNFANLCAASGVLCNESQEDENGWDCLVEFPADKSDRHADTHPPAKCAFVQVKSTRTTRPSCPMKLSNALKAAQSRDPWFVVLMVATGAKSKIYAVHIWEPLIEKILKAVRQAAIDKAPLHRKRFTISFANTDLHTDDLIEWMGDTIRSVAPEYGQAKKRVYETVGYADGYGTGKITFATDSADKIFDEFLGLGSGLPISKFTFTPARFGLSDSSPHIDVTEGTVQITPTAAGDCEIRMRGLESRQSISVAAKMFILGMPFLPVENQRFRVAATGFEIVWISDSDSTFTASLDFNARVTLNEIGRFATVITWLKKGSVDVQVWGKGHRLVGGVLAFDPGRLTYDWSKVSDMVETLNSLHSKAETDDLRVSVGDINAAARDLYLMYQVTSAPNICLEFYPLSGQFYDFGSVLYYSVADVGTLTAYALVERKLSQWSEGEGGRRRVEFGPPIIRESWVVSEASETQRKMIIDDYQHHLSEMEKSTKTLEVGDIAVFIVSLKSEGLIQLPTRP